MRKETRPGCKKEENLRKEQERRKYDNVLETEKGRDEEREHEWKQQKKKNMEEISREGIV